MSAVDPSHAVVKRPALKGKTPAQCINIVETICEVAEQCAEVQASATAAPALAALKGVVGAAHASLDKKLTLAQELLAAIKGLNQDMGRLRTVLGIFTSAVDGVAQAPHDLVTGLNEIVGSYGFGRLDMVENRRVGIKSREVYECPASLALILAHRETLQCRAERANQRAKLPRIILHISHCPNPGPI